MRVNDSWLLGLESALIDYPHRITIPRHDNFGMGLFSKCPFTPLPLEPHSVPVIGVSVQCSSKPPTILLLVHLAPPISTEAMEINRGILAMLRQAAENAGSASLVVVGDFNATPHSVTLRRFVRETSLRYAAHGFGYRHTWNALGMMERLMIDHAFVSAEVGEVMVRRLDSIGSDHYPLLVKWWERQRQPG